MSFSKLRTLGAAARIIELFGDKVFYDLRDPEGAALYYGLTSHDKTEVNELLHVAQGHPGPVLELACGFGRVAAPFLAKVFEVVALDYSKAMLDICRERLKGLRAPDTLRTASPLSRVT